MNSKFSFYLEKNNQMFNNDVLVVCYKADDKEIKKYNLTTDTIVVFVVNNKIKQEECKGNLNYIELITKAFEKEKVLLRIQCECLLGMYGDSHCDCEKQRLEAINILSKNNGIYIHLPQEAQGWGLHYKLKELELQLSGRMQDGKYIGIKNRDEAQKIILGHDEFKDNRSYEIVYNILEQLGLKENEFVLLSDSKKKITEMQNLGLNIVSYNQYKAKAINSDNLSEYLIKILNSTHKFSEDVIDEIVDKIVKREYNERTLATLVNIVNKIKNDKNYNLDEISKGKFISAYNNIICGEEKKYFVGEENIVKIQNNFSCRVNTAIFKIIKKIYNKNIFDRISLEKLYYFQNKYSSEIVKIRTSQILEVKDENTIYFKGQHHAQQRIINNEKNTIIQNEVTVSKLRSYFENPNYDYVKRVEMITTISEYDIPGVKVFVKRIPTFENRILDIFGKKEDIKKFLDNIMEYGQNVLLNSVTNIDYEEENFTEHNLRFADLNGIIEEELEIYNLLNGGNKNGV